MALKRMKNVTNIVESPQELFRDLKNREVKGLFDHQSEMLERYMDIAYDESSIKDVALELPTGSGKTLIGLLIGEFRRVKNKERVVYLCPNKQLANQVVEQSVRKYGIKTHAFIGSQYDFDAAAVGKYNNSDIIAVTTYSALFNSNPFFYNPDIIILDDAHSAEEYIASYWSLQIDRVTHHSLFHSIVQVLKGSIDEQSYQRLTSPYPQQSDSDWVEKVPFPLVQSLSSVLIPIIDEGVSENDLKFSWKVIRENLHACFVYISYKEILIRPILPPTLTHSPFKDASQRIYMSATLGKSGELERTIGIEEIRRLPIQDSWRKQALGRRFFLFPSAQFSTGTVENCVIELCKKVDRAVILVPDTKTGDRFRDIFSEKTNLKLIRNDDIRLSKSSFTEETGIVAILANRFDGIDFEGNQCRMLVVSGLPKNTHLQEKFIISKMATSVLFSERIRTRIIQALGRCTRGPVDYAAVCILENKLIDELVPKKKAQHFHPELQAEIEYGYFQSQEAKDIDEFFENFDIFMEYGDDWQYAEQDIIDKRNEKEELVLDEYDKLFVASKFEVKFMYALWRKDYENAFQYANQVLQNISGPRLTGYRGFWNYIAGNVAFLLVDEGNESYNSRYAKHYIDAASCTNSITWLKRVVKTYFKDVEMEIEDEYIGYQIENIERLFVKLGVTNDRKFEKLVKNINDSIDSTGTKFEDTQVKLGELLGFVSDNSDDNAAPDPWWILGDKLCIVFEDKIYEDKDKLICVSDVRQAKCHKDWILRNIEGLSPDVQVYTVLLSNSKTVEKAAMNFADDIYYWELEDFINWQRDAQRAIREAKVKCSGEGDQEWRKNTIQQLQLEKLTPNYIIEKVQKSELSSLHSI